MCDNANGSTAKRDRRIGSLPAPNAKEPSSLSPLANLSKKRKANDMGDTDNIDDASRTRFPIKQRPRSFIDDTQSHGRSTDPSTCRIKQEPGTDATLSRRDNVIANIEEGVSRPSSKIGDSLPEIKEEADAPSHESRGFSDVQDRVSSSDLNEPDMWDISESECYTDEAEEDASDRESLGSNVSVETERRENLAPSEASQGPENGYDDSPDIISSGKGAVPNDDNILRERRTKRTSNAYNATEQVALANSTPHDHNNHNNHARDESGEISTSRHAERMNETTITGKPRQRALPKYHNPPRDISRSWKTADPADKMLMKMKRQGCGWLEIRKAWQELTGEWPAPSTLPNRYKRVKENLTRLESGDVRMLHFLLAVIC